MPVEVETINRERLQSWEQKLNGEHATAQIIIGVGHDHVKGKIIVVVPENINLTTLKLFALNAINEFISQPE